MEGQMIVRFRPLGLTIEVEAGKTLLEAAVSAGVEIESVCGGRGTCAKCKVIASDGLLPPSDMELKGLTETELRNGYRLACQAIIQSDVDVVVPEESRVSRVSILSEGVDRGVPLEPWVQRHVFHVPPATLDDPISDLQNVIRAWQVRNSSQFAPTLRALRQLPLALRERDGQIALIVVDDRVVRIDPGKGPERILGMAFDIGTTTVVGYLIDLETGQELAVSSLLNPQTRYGDDVVSRIGFCSEHDSGLKALQGEIVGAVNKIIAEATLAASVPPEDIFGLTVVGNTTMLHLLLGISPEALARSPYVPAATAAMQFSAEELGIAVCPDAHVWALPGIAGWVGADAVGVILSTGLHKGDGITLAVDIGTNGEIAMGSYRRFVTCSTAAGPAFEGAHISCGMRAADGAIDSVAIDSDVRWHAIGERPPRGICGSGLVDAVAEMLRAGIIDSTGMMQDSETVRADGHGQLSERIVQVGGQREFQLVRATEGTGSRTIKVTQRDVRELQLAKGAIRAGIEILMKELRVGPEEVERVYLAGAFGNYVRPESALGIGLIPRFPNAEIVPVGNAAGSGAKMALVSASARAEAVELAARSEYLELSARPDFQGEFVEAMLFQV